MGKDKLTLEGKVKGITAATIALKRWNGVMGPGSEESITGAVPQYGFRIVEDGKSSDTLVYFNAYNNIQIGKRVTVTYEINEGKKFASQIDITEDGKVVERYIKSY